MENLEIDLSLALQMQAQFEEELRVSLLKEEEKSKNQLISQNTSNQGSKRHRGELKEPSQEKLSVSLVDPSWELIDPNPDIHTLFLTFNNQFFWGRLSGIEVKWSPRMTLCAGVCSYEGRGGLCSVRLSLPLLKLRPRKDLIETLLHEMIHAYLFVTANNRDRDGHGPEFHKHMYRINGVAGTKISVYHSFHDEVDVYRQHIWQCDGPCRKRRPYFGLLKRVMNRAPGPRDPWWLQHQQSCGGTYTKIQEPDGYGVKKKKTGLITDDKKIAGTADIRKFFGSFQGKGKSLMDNSVSTAKNKRSKDEASPSMKENIPGFSGEPFIGNNSAANSFGRNDDTSKVKGFGSTGTGTVKRLNVNNATHSRVHGFSGSNSPVKKKPKVNSGESNNSTSGGSKRSGGTSQPGLGMAVRTGGGSRTISVKGKAKTKNEDDTGYGESSIQAPPFQGQGYALGGGSGVSRLLSLSSSTSLSHTNVNLHKKDLKISKSSETPSTFKDHNPIGKCPVCNKDIPQIVLDKHVSDCIGDFDDGEDWNLSCPRENAVVDKNIDEMDTISISSDDSDNFALNRNNPSASSKRESSESTVSEEKFPCPVCGSYFSRANINDHLDTHF